MEQQRLQILIDKVLKGQATAKERQELDEWYAAQDASDGFTAGLNNEQKSAMGKELFDSIHHRIQVEQAPVRTNYRKWLVAAVVLLVVAAGAFYFITKQPVTAPATLASVWKETRTAHEVRRIAMADGSTIWLNAGSSLRYDSNFVSGKREVWMQGEAFFDVAHMEGKPFEVHTGKITTRVLGTAFNVNAYTPEENIEVFVKRGKVSVSDSTNTSGILLPDQRMVYKADGTFERFDSVTVDYASWTTGQLQFRDMPFSEVAKRLEQRFGVHLIFKDPSIGQCSITATFNANTPVKDMLDMLAITNGSTITPADNNTFIISGKKQCK